MSLIGRSEGLARVNAHLAKSRECAREGAALLDRTGMLREQAFALLPDGVRLKFWTDLHDVVIEKTPDGWVGSDGVAEDPVEVDDDWVLENWLRNNWLILEAEG